MGFSTAVSTCFSRYFTFSGRAPRAEYWYWVLFVLLVSVVLAVVDLALMGPGRGQPLSALFSLAVLFPGLAVSVRRLHDIGRSGWWVLIAIIPLVGAILLLVWFARESDPGDNEFGPNPYSA
ncbi:MAG: DUF805 domain-containing protein [Rhodobacteraceae bacterium]|nr:DUF805 domain-containing protein [Paracoccaceae bacterium]